MLYTLMVVSCTATAALGQFAYTAPPSPLTTTSTTTEMELGLEPATHQLQNSYLLSPHKLLICMIEL